MKEMLKQLDEHSRRDFISHAAKACLGVSALPMMSGMAFGAGGAPAKNVIYLFMDGGMTHLDTFDPKPGTDVAGDTKAIKTNVDGVQFGEYLPKLAKCMDKMTLVRSVSSKQGEHERAKYLMRTSYNMISTIRHPALGAWLLKMQGKGNETLPGFITVGGGARHPGAGFLDGRFAPLPVGNPQAGLPDSKIPAGVTEGQYRDRLQLADALDRSFRNTYRTQEVKAYTDFYADALKIMKSQDLKAFDIASESQAVKETYGTSNFGQGCMLARRLVQHGVRFVEVSYGGWDMHYELWDRIENHAGVLDTAFSALINDLDKNGMLRDTLVVLGSDFGRTPKISDRVGRDHHPRCFTTVVAGGPFKRGYVHGKSDAKAFAPEEGAVTVEDFNASIAQGLGLPLDKQIFSPSGRPFTVANKGKVISDIFA
jgi:uncharacterized protein (DUF1501 family)